MSRGNKKISRFESNASSESLIAFFKVQNLIGIHLPLEKK
jgi:hypothetical protein